MMATMASAVITLDAAADEDQKRVDEELMNQTGRRLDAAGAVPYPFLLPLVVRQCGDPAAVALV